MIVRQEDMTREFALRVIQHNRTPQGYVTVEFKDGLKDLPIQLVVLHCPVWEIFRHFGIPVTTSHISHKVSPMNKKSFMKMMEPRLMMIVINNILKGGFLSWVLLLNNVVFLKLVN